MLEAVVTDEALVGEALAAKETAENVEAEAGSPYRWTMADRYLALSERGWTQQRIAKKCKVNQSSVSKYIACAREYSVLNNRPTFWEAFKDFNSESVHFSSDSDEWETPQDLFDVLDAEFGFELDVCASHENHKCDVYFTQDDDGLSQEWRGVCWMNPPYSTIADWMEKAWESAKDGATVVCLVPARFGSAHWWDYGRYGQVRMLKGRLKFGNSENSAPFDSAVVVFGPDVESDFIWWER